MVGAVGDAAEEEGSGGGAAENGLELGFAANVAEGGEGGNHYAMASMPKVS